MREPVPTEQKQVACQIAAAEGSGSVVSSNDEGARLTPRRPRRLYGVGAIFCGCAILLLVGLFLALPSLRAWHHLRAARSEIQRSHYAQAARHLRVCMQKWPK